MWDALGNVIRTFLEKYFIPTLISFVLGTLLYILTPIDCPFLERLTPIWYFCFLYGVIFLIVQFIVFLYGKWKFMKRKRYMYKEIDEGTMREEKEIMKKVWKYVDGLSEEDRAYLKAFLESGNKPIKKTKMVGRSFDSLFSSKYVHKQEHREGNQIYEEYILEENFYELLLYSKNKYGKISNFDEV